MTTAPLAAAVAKPGWNTLQILKVSRVVIIGLAGLLMISVIVGTGVHRDAMKTVGKDSAPSIIDAQHIKAALADMDADAVNELLEPTEAQNATAHDATAKAYEARRVEATNALIEAAENITFGDAERGPIQSLELGMGTYERQVQKANDFHDTGNAGAVMMYRDAARTMDQTLLPAADALDHANNDELEKAYKAQSSNSLSARAFIVVAGLLLLAALVLAQGFLSYKTRRTLNPLLLMATILTLGLTVYSLAAMGDEQQELKAAKEDAFASIRSLWRARAVAYEANSEESRYLLDAANPVNAAEDERIFAAETNSLATLPVTGSLDQVLTSESNGHKVKGFTGYLADELNNITFNGEREAAVATLAGFEKYLKVDGDMRRLEQGGQHRQAVELCLGTADGQSNWAFARFDEALGKTLEINQSAFDEAVEKGLAGMSGLEIKAAVVSVMIAVLVFLGLAGRIREYE